MAFQQAVRGRPITFPRDISPMGDLNADSGPRLAWLLLRSRLHSGDPILRQRKTFADGLVRLGVNAEPSRVSRWESGSHRVPERVLYGYSTLLGHPPGHFTSIAHNLRSAIDPQAEPGVLLIQNIPSTQAELDEVFTELAADRANGQSWTRLAASIQTGTYMYLPEEMWTNLTDQLLGELVRSSRIAHIRRLTASGVVAQHVPAQRFLIKSVGRLVTAPGSRFVTPALSLLRDIPSPEADALLLRMIQTPRGQLRRGSATTIASKIAHGRMDEAAVAQIEEILPGLLEKRGQHNYPTDIVNVLAALDSSAQDRVLKRLTDRSTIADLEETLYSGLSVPTDRAHRLAAMIARRATTLVPLPGAPAEADQMLVRLIEEALFHVHRERRYQAGLLLGVSPFTTALPTALMQSLDNADQYTVSRCLSLISFLRPGPELAPQLLQWILHSPKKWLKCRAMAALTPLGHQIGRAAQEELAAMITTADDPEVLHTGLNLLGLIAAPALDNLATGDSDLKAASQWWLDFGPLITEDTPDPSHSASQNGAAQNGDRP